MQNHIPGDKSLDNSLALLHEGYLYIPNRIKKFQTDLFTMRFLGQEVICMSGEEAANVFYDPERFQRHGAAPKRIQETLFGVGGIQTLDGEAHDHRRKLFLSLLERGHQKQMAELVRKQLMKAIGKWETAERIVLFDEAGQLLCRTVCHWAGVPLPEDQIRERTRDFVAMVDAFGAVGPRHWKGRVARNQAEAWIRGIIEDVRSGALKAEEGSPLHTMAFHRELGGNLLDSQTAAVELINILRPVVAISTYIAFTALAMYEHPACLQELRTGDEDKLERFVHEVRRYYPFGPFLGARVRKPFAWKQCEFKENALVFLDMYGTNRDPRIWDRPEEFRPERFGERKHDLYGFIPQGGGDPVHGHRCPGEGMTVEIMKTVLDVLANNIEFDVPEQDFSYSLSRMPTLPKSGFVMESIKRK